MKHLIILFIATLAATRCTTDDGKVLVSNHGPAQGSTYNISYVAPLGTDYRYQIDSILLEIDKSMSLWINTSTISKINRGENVQPDAHFLNVLKYARYVSKTTEGAFDVTIAPLVQAWGFGTEDKTVLDSAMVDSMLQFIGWHKIMIKKDSLFVPRGVKLDFNAIAQGYTVDVIADYLESQDIVNYMVEVGGELKTKGKTIDGRIWTIGIDKPQEELDQENRYQVVVKLKDAALATSGDYRRFKIDEQTGIKYAHAINPKTGYPVKSRLISVTIVTDNAMAADAWATACMVLGLEEAKKLVTEKSLDAYFVYSDLSGKWQIWQTEGFKKITL